MKSSARVGALLTALMLVLVLIAAIIFLFQVRQTLLTRNDSLQTDLHQTENERDGIAQARDAVTAVLATVESDTVLLEGQLVDSQQEVDALSQQLTETSNNLTQLEQERLELLSRPPQVSIVAPVVTTNLEAGTPIEMIAVATDAVGVTTVFLTVDDQIIGNYVVTDLPLVTVSESWTPIAAGEYVMGVEASNGRTSTLITKTLSIVAPISEDLFTIAAANSSLRTTLETNVADLRGLRSRFPVVEVGLTADALQQRVADRVAIAPSEQLTGMLTSFDFVQSEADIAFFFDNELTTEASYYDLETGEMLLLADEAGWTPSDQLAYVHQYVRLLQDQYFSLRAIDEILNEDVKLALSALSVGEANLVQTLYLRSDHLSEDDRIAIFNMLDGAETAVSSYLLAEQQFQDVAGLDFVQAIYDGGAFTAVSALWETLPQSTEQILHPELYVAGHQPQAITIPLLNDVLGVDWTLLTENTLGEFRLRAYLAQQLNPEQVDTAASGWGGDSYVIYQRSSDDAQVMLLWLAWDSLDDSVEFAALYPNYPTRLFNTSGELQSDSSECWQGESDLICLYQNEDETFVLRVPNLEMATAVATLLNQE
ncbi:MAG: hypothetical protein GY943_32555 [Chloroflexi bacterium]|nr:hypothetical protein [Chloroflexota bacterium]